MIEDIRARCIKKTKFKKKKYRGTVVEEATSIQRFESDSQMCKR